MNDFGLSKRRRAQVQNSQRSQCHSDTEHAPSLIILWHICCTARPTMTRFALFLSALLAAFSAHASEVDNYSTQGFRPVEVIDVFNRHLNEGTQEVIRDWGSKPADPVRFAKEVHRKLKWERWYRSE